MSESIHGHQVMEMMANSGKTFSQSELIVNIASVFGDNARFHTCMDSNLTSQMLIDFFTAKGKIIQSEQGLCLALNNSC